MEKDWKLKLRYGKLKTPFKHFTAIANGEVVEIVEDFDYKLGKAYI